MPLAAIAGVLTRYAIKRYKESALYHGERTTARPSRRWPSWPSMRRRADGPAAAETRAAAPQEMTQPPIPARGAAGQLALRLWARRRRMREDDFIVGDGNRLALCAYPRLSRLGRRR